MSVILEPGWMAMFRMFLFQSVEPNRYKASVQSNKSISMETYTLLSLSVLKGLLIHFAFCGVSILIARRHKNVAVEKSAPKNNVDRCGRPTRIFIPNVLARWPWPRRINPNYAVVKKEAAAWMTSFRAFSPKAQDAFDRCDFSGYFPSYPVHIPILFDRSARLLSLPDGKQR